MSNHVDLSETAARATLRRLKKRGDIVSPRRGFYVVVPAEYRSLQSPPASWFIDDLMKYLDRPYYVALLTAASFHGASHQQPMAFQVMTCANERPISVGQLRIEFQKKLRFDLALSTKIQTETGIMNISIVEATVLDLIHFPSASGYWSHLATVILELVDKVDADRLLSLTSHYPNSDVQRLGWLLTFLEKHELATALEESLQEKRLVPVHLNLKRKNETGTLDDRWKVIVNDTVEPDV